MAYSLRFTDLAANAMMNALTAACGGTGILRGRGITVDTAGRRGGVAVSIERVLMIVLLIIVVIWAARELL